MSLWLVAGFGAVWLPLAAAVPNPGRLVTIDDATIVFDLAFRRRFVVPKNAVTRMWWRGAATVIEWRDGARYRRAYLMPPMTNRAEVMGALAGGPWGKRRRS